MVFWVLSPWVHGILIATPLSPHYRSGVVDACGSSVNPRGRAGHGVGLWQHGGHMRKESPLGLKELRGSQGRGRTLWSHRGSQAAGGTRRTGDAPHPPPAAVRPTETPKLGLFSL